LWRTSPGLWPQSKIVFRTLAAASAVFSWAVKQEIVAVNPCRGIELNATQSRERVLSATEIRAFFRAISSKNR
jgi:hypothetical protein